MTTALPTTADRSAAAAARPRRELPVRGIAMVVVVIGSAFGLGRPLWLDEAYTVGALHQPWVNVVDDRGACVLYYLLLRPFALVSEAGWWLRLPSVAASVGAVYLLHGWTRKRYGAPVAGLAAVYVAVSWSVIEHAQEARPYALVLLLTVAGWACATRWLETGDRWAYRAWLLISALSPLVHGLSVLQTGAQWIVVEASGFDRAQRRRARLAFATSAVVPVGLTLVGAASLTPYQPATTPANVFRVFESLTGPGPVAVLLALFAALGLRHLLASSTGASSPMDRFWRLAPVGWALAPLVALTLVSLAQPKLVLRYVLGSIGGVAVLVALGLASIRPELWRRLAVATVLVALAVWQLEGHRAGTGDWQAAARIVADEGRPGDAIVFPRANRRPPFEAAWLDLASPPKLAVVNPSRPLGEVRWLEDDAPVRSVVDRASAHDRLWVVTEPFASLDREQPVADGLKARGYEVREVRDLGHRVTLYLFVRSR